MFAFISFTVKAVKSRVAAKFTVTVTAPFIDIRGGADCGTLRYKNRQCVTYILSE